MKVLEETPHKLILERKHSKKFFFYLLFMLLLGVCLVLFDIYKGNTDAFFSKNIFLIILIVSSFDVILLVQAKRITTIIVDKENNKLTIREKGIFMENKKEIGLDEIQKVKTQLRWSYIWRDSYAILVFVLHNNKEIALKPNVAYFGINFPFSLDYFANKDHAIGKKIADFLGIPFQEGEMKI